MKKFLYTLILFFSISPLLAGTLAFCDKNGTVYSDGSVVRVTAMEDDPFLGQMMPSGVYLKNVTKDDYMDDFTFSVTIEGIDNGYLSVCYPDLCYSFTETGVYNCGTASLDPGQMTSILTEWFPTTYGTCRATFKAGLPGDETSITVLFDHSDPATASIEWGYYNGDGSTLVGLGATGSTDYEVAMLIPGTGDLSGGQISGIKVPVFNRDVIKSMKVWVSKSLKDSMTYDMAKEVALDILPKGAKYDTDSVYFTVKFDSLFNIPKDGCYIGYSFTTEVTTSDELPILLDASTQNAKAAYVKADKAGNAWASAGGNYGVSGMKALIFNINLPDAAAWFKEFDHTVTVAGSDMDFDVYVLSNAGQTVKNIEYVLSVNGKETKRTADVNVPAGFDQYGMMKMTIPAPAETGTYTVKLHITKVNGMENSELAKVTEMTFKNVLRKVERNTLVEEFTGTTCGNCPRGIVGMERMKKKYGERFVAVALHQYSGNVSADAMYFKNYRDHGLNSAPSALVDGQLQIDPYVDTASVKPFLEVPALCDLQLSAQWTDATRTKVKATSTVEVLMDGTYTVAYVLVADSLHGETNAWMQSNYYASETPSVDEELNKWCKGGELTKYPFPYYMDVAIGSSYVGTSNLATRLGTLTAGTTKENSYSMKLPTTPETLVETLNDNINNVYAIAIVFNSDGTVANAKKVKVEVPEGIETVTKKAQNDDVFNLMGVKVGENYKGIVIKNGHKILIK